MPEACIIILILSGIALVANVAICLYTLCLAKQAEHRQYIKGFTAAFLYCEEYTKTQPDNTPEHSTPENPDTQN